MKGQDATLFPDRESEAEKGMREQLAASSPDKGGDLEIKTRDQLVAAPLEEEDILAVHEIEQSTFSVPWSEDAFRSSLERSDAHFLTIKKDGEILGYGGFLMACDEAEIMNIAVKEGYRGQGLGHRLMEELISCGERLGVELFVLEARVSNRRAIQLYQDMGFTVQGIRRGFYARPTEDAAVMFRRKKYTHGR